MNLIIVESPTKAKTLGRFLGKDFRITATMGHIRDLPPEKLGVNIEENFRPDYVLLEGKKKVVTELKRQAKKAKKIFLATDPDREGEAIAYHVYVICSNSKLQSKIKKEDKFSRITFHEITKSAIDKALSHPGTINMQLVDAQQARRVLDRLVGYKLSPLLWRKIRRGLSAGRVQSVAVRLIVDREREIEKFIPEEYWEILAELRRHIGGKKPGVPTFIAKLAQKNGQKIKVGNENTAREILAELKSAGYEVARVEQKKVVQNPPPPLTTSTLQQQAAYRLRFSSKRTMYLAQALYEKGLITYHRTDSLNLASEAVDEIRRYIDSTFGEKYLAPKPRFYKTKSKVAQEAHEAIRPTDVGMTNDKLQMTNKDEARLYDLIWKRTIACQMAGAIWDQTKVEIQAAGRKNIYALLSEGKIMEFKGFLLLYKNDDEEAREAEKAKSVSSDSSVLSVIKKASGLEPEMKEEGLKQLPELKEGDELDLIRVDGVQKFTQPPPRYSEATLIKTLEEKGIGRPSTYAPIVSTIQERQYVEKSEGRFHPTSLGVTVNDFLVEYFPDIFDYDFTAQMENELDEIAEGKREWGRVIKDFYQPFENKLMGVTKAAERVQVPTEVTGEKCPQCQEGQLVVRVGKFGKFISCSRFPKCKYTARFTAKLEGVACPKCGGEVVIKKSKKGRQFYGCSHYPKCNWASWQKPKQAL